VNPKSPAERNPLRAKLSSWRARKASRLDEHIVDSLLADNPSAGETSEPVYGT
jgi:hypothetical protein